MVNPSHSMVLSPINKRRSLSFDEESQDLALETNQLMIQSPYFGNASKRPRYEPSWTLDNLCTHPCSPLATIDLESIFNLPTFHLLPQNKRDELYSLLPQVDQNALLNHHDHLNHESHDSGYYSHISHESYDPIHYSSFPYHHNQYIVQPTSFFSKSENPVFWNSLSEWQSMLGQGEFIHPDSPPLPLSPSPPTSTTHMSCINKSSNLSSKSKPTKSPKPKTCLKKEKIKDDAFESYWGEIIDKEKTHNVAGDSKSITLKDMCRKGLIREHDVIVYKRNFSACKVVVSKSMTVVKACGLSGISIKLDDEIFEDFETPTALETKILDHHGKVTKDKRPNGNAFKSIRLIRAGKDMGRLFDIRKDGFGDPSTC